MFGKQGPRSVNGTLTNQQRSLLDAIASKEAPAGYNTLYGGKQYVGDQHPNIAAPIVSGPNVGLTTSAAGRYQMLGRTWRAEQNKLGLPDYSPENQDLAAIDLARTAYNNQTGRNLDTDLNDPSKLSDIASALHSTWTSLPGGIEQGQQLKEFADKIQQSADYYSAADLASNPLASAHVPGMSPDNADRLAEREANITGAPPTQETYSPNVPDTSVNPYGGLTGALGAGVTAAIKGFNGLGDIASSIGGLFSPTQQPSVSLPNHPQTPTPLSGIGPPGAVTSASLPAVSLPHPQSTPYGPPAVSQPAHPSTPTPQDGGLGGLLGTLGRAAIGGPLGGSYQSTAGSNNPYQGASHPYESGYTPSYSQLAPGAATATQMFGADPSPVATDKPSFTTTRSLNPNYQSQMAAYNAALNANVPSAVDSFAAAPGLSAVTDPGANPWGEFDGPPKAPAAPKIGPVPSKYISTQVPTAPSLPSFSTGTPVYGSDGKVVGAIGQDGKAFTADFDANTPVTDQTGATVGTISGHTMQAQKLGLLGQLSNLFGGPPLPTVPNMISNVIGGAYGGPPSAVNGPAAPHSSILGSLGAINSGQYITGNGAYQTSNSNAYGPTTYGTQSYQGGSHSTLGGGDGHRAL